MVIIPGVKIGPCSPLEEQAAVIRGHVFPLSCGVSDDSEAINPKVVFEPRTSLIFRHEL